MNGQTIDRVTSWLYRQSARYRVEEINVANTGSAVPYQIIGESAGRVFLFLSGTDSTTFVFKTPGGIFVPWHGAFPTSQGVQVTFTDQLLLPTYSWHSLNLDSNTITGIAFIRQ